jgi:hypothetical protein
MPTKVTPDLIEEWSELGPVNSNTELVERYSVFDNDINKILDFIESGAPREKRRGKHYTYAKEIRENSGQNVCNICNSALIDIAGESRYDWDLRTIEHIISLDWGGSTTPENSVIICKSCNEAFDWMISGLLPGRITLNKHGGKQKIKNDQKRRRIRTPQQIANLPDNWKSTVSLQYMFQRVVVCSTEIAKRDFPQHWEKFVQCKYACIEASNKSMLKINPSYIPRVFDGF